MAKSLTVLGVRCSNRDFAYAVLTGSKDTPKNVEVRTLPYPKGFAKPQSLHWLLQEIHSVLKRHSIQKIVLKQFEGKSRGGTFEDRVEHEAAVMLAGGSLGLRAVFKKMNSTIAKDLGQKGRSKYLASLDTWNPTFDSFSDKEREAIHAAWSNLPDGCPGLIMKDALALATSERFGWSSTRA